MKGKLLRIVRCFAVVAVLWMPVQGFAAGGSSIAFGITAPKTKIGDAGGHPTYGGGQHNIAVYGNEVYVAYTNINDYTNEREVCVGKSLDGGLTWQRSEVIAHGPNIDIDGAAIAVGPDLSNPAAKIIHVAWGELDPLTGQMAIYYARQPGAGSGRVKISGSIPADGYARSLAADGVGGVHVSFSNSYGVYYSRSLDGGANFDTIGEVIDNTYPNESSIAADSAGNVYVAWWYYNQGVFFSRRLAGSGVWSPPVKMNGAIPLSYVSLAVQDVNHIYIAWGGNPQQLTVASTANGGLNAVDWIQNAVINHRVDNPSIVVDATGVVSIVWADTTATTWGTYFSRSTDGGRRWTTPIYVDSTRRFPNLAVDSNGKVYMMLSGYGEDIVYFTKEN